VGTDYDDYDLRIGAAESGACAYTLKQNLTNLAGLIRSVTGKDK
jgi:hypothetical protein